MVDQSAPCSTLQMKMIWHGTLVFINIVESIKELKTTFVQLNKHFLFFLWYIFQIKTISQFLHLLCCMTTKKQRIIRHIKKFLLVIVYQVNTLIGNTSKSLYGLYQCREYIGILVRCVAYGVRCYKEIFYVCHIC